MRDCQIVVVCGRVGRCTLRSITSLLFASKSCFVLSASADGSFSVIISGCGSTFSVSVDCHLRSIRGGKAAVARGDIDDMEENGDICVRRVCENNCELARSWRSNCRLIILQL